MIPYRFATDSYATPELSTCAAPYHRDGPGLRSVHHNGFAVTGNGPTQSYSMCGPPFTAVSHCASGYSNVNVSNPVAPMTRAI